MKVLLTGGSGYIGSRTIPHLLGSGFEVHLALRDPGAVARDPRFADCHLHPADLLDDRAVAGLVARVQPSHLLHLAWYTEHGKFWQAPQNADWQLASLQLAAHFMRQGGRRMVGAGTCAEYDWSSGHCDEATTACAPSSFYGQCKHQTGVSIGSWMAHSGLSHAWGRVFFLYGEDEAPARLVPSVARHFLRGTPAPCTQGSQRRDYLHVQDAAAAFSRLLACEVQGNVNIASGEPTSVRALVEQFGAGFPGRADVRFGALPERADEPPCIQAAVQRLRHEVGFRPVYTLAAGLAATAQWWLDRAAGGMAP